MSSSFGTGPNQAPINQFLGKLAFVDSVTPVPKQIAANYTITPADNGKILVVSGTRTITLPLADDVLKNPDPFLIGIKPVTGATVTVARSGSDTIETVSGNKTMTANVGLWFFPSASGAWETM